MDKPAYNPDKGAKGGKKGASTNGRSGRKNNPDYEPKQIKTRDGVLQTVYYKKKNNKAPPKKNVGTPQKRRGAFKGKTSKGNTGMLNAPPSNASSMAQPIGNYMMEQNQKKASLLLETMNALSDKKREVLQGQYNAPGQKQKMSGRSRTNPSA